MAAVVTNKVNKEKEPFTDRLNRVDNELSQISQQVNLIHGFIVKLFGKSFQDYCESQSHQQQNTSSKFNSQPKSEMTVTVSPELFPQDDDQDKGVLYDRDEDEEELDYDEGSETNQQEPNDLYGDSINSNGNSDDDQYGSSSISNYQQNSSSSSSRIYNPLEPEVSMSVGSTTMTMLPNISRGRGRPPKSSNLSSSLPVRRPSVSMSVQENGNLPRVINGVFFSLVSRTNDGRIEARCRICKQIKLIKGLATTSSNFLTHLKRVHPPEYELYAQGRSHQSYLPGIKSEPNTKQQQQGISITPLVSLTYAAANYNRN